VAAYVVEDGDEVVVGEELAVVESAGVVV